MTRSSQLIGSAIAILLCSIPAAAEFDLHFASGALSAGRNDTLVCVAQDGNSALLDLKVSLKSPFTKELIHPEATASCQGGCSISHRNGSPIPLVAYCHVEAVEPELILGEGDPYTGNLRLDNPNGVSQVSTDAQPAIPRVCPAPGDFQDQTKPFSRHATGFLSLGRNDTAVCTGINKGDGNATVLVTLKYDGIDSRRRCVLAPGEGCEASYKHPSAQPVDVFCDIRVDGGGPVLGNLRRDDPVNVSEASTDLAANYLACATP